MSKAPSSLIYAAIWLPRFHLQAITRQQALPARIPMVVLDSDHQSASKDGRENKGRVLHANPKAEKAGVVIDMTASQAQARCANLLVLTRDVAAERQAQEELLECASLWTPDYESSQPGLGLLDLSRSPLVQRNKIKAAECMRRWLIDRKLHAQIGIAHNADLATLTAHAAKTVLVYNAGHDEESSYKLLLKQLPITTLKLSRELSNILHLWGIHTLAEFAILTRSDVAARLGSEGVWLWEIASGGRERLLELVRPVIGYRTETELEHPLECLEPLLFILKRQLDQLCRKLADAWLVASAQLIQLCFDDHTNYEKTLRVAEPTRDAELLLRVLHTHLEGLSAKAPITAVGLELTPMRPTSQQSNLFERQLRDPNRLSETLAQLEALLGIGNVGKVQLLPSRRLDAFNVVNYLEPKTPEIKTFGTTLVYTGGLPLRRYRPTLKTIVKQQNDRPVAVQINGTSLRVIQTNGPWLMSGEWWTKGRWDRIIWQVATDNGEMYQLAQEKDGWVVDGIFA